MADEQTYIETPPSGPADVTAPVPQPAEPVLSPLLKAVRAPIPGANPCGTDASYIDDFLAVKAEIDKIGSVGGRVDQEKVAELRQAMDAKRGAIKKEDVAKAESQLGQQGSVAGQFGGVDYTLIKEKASAILTEKSKDLRVASYLCFALWQSEKFFGLSEGIGAIDILVREFWDGMYPAKARLAARRNAIDFLTSKLSETVEYAQVAAEDREPLERAKTVLTELQKHFAEKMPDSPPSMAGLAQAVEKCLKRLPKPAPPPSAASSVSAASPVRPQQAGSDSTQTMPAPTDSADIKTNQDAIDAVKRAAKFLREQNRKSAAPYRLLRCSRWDALVAAPPNENGKTKIEPPPPQRRNALAGLRDAGDWNKLLDECESSFGQPPFHFWLDMQRMTVAALDGLGSEYSHVRTAVLTELALLLQRVPKLFSLAFSDGTRFADPATCDWIEEIVTSVLGSADSGPTRHSMSFDDPDLDAKFAEAKKVLDGGDLAGAIALLKAGAMNDNSRKSAFRRKLAMATLCMRGNQPSIARPLLEDLERDIDKFSIDAWEPALALEAWTNLHKCYESLASGPASPSKQAMQQSADKVFEKICRLDVGYALASTGAKPKTKISLTVSKSESKPTNGATEMAPADSEKGK